MAYSVGDIVVLDGIESVIIYDNGSEADWGRYICVDKNHDLSYYITGSDYVDSEDYKTHPGTFGYEWGGYLTTTGVTSQEVGSGLSNTNSLISKNLQPNTSGWYVLWDKVKEFRNSRSDKWFVPSQDELNLVYNNKSSLSNLSLNNTPGYWSSSESDYIRAYYEDLDRGYQNDVYKYTHYDHTRLCRYTTDQELTKTIQITSTTDQALIYYTIDNSTPSQNSNLYSNTFQVQTGTTIKAIGIKEGYIDSDIATLTV